MQSSYEKPFFLNTKWGFFFESTTFTIPIHKQLANGLTIIKGCNEIITFFHNYQLNVINNSRQEFRNHFQHNMKVWSILKSAKLKKKHEISYHQCFVFHFFKIASMVTSTMHMVFIWLKPSWCRSFV